MSALDDLAFLDATAQAELVRQKKIKAIELVEAAIERIQRLNPTLNAVVTPMFDLARETAAGKIPDGPFQGVPFLLKDLIAEYAGVRFTEGSAFLQDYISDHDKWDVWLTPILAEPPVPLGTFDSKPDDPMHGFSRSGKFMPFTRSCPSRHSVTSPDSRPCQCRCFGIAITFRSVPILWAALVMKPRCFVWQHSSRRQGHGRIGVRRCQPDGGAKTW